MRFSKVYSAQATLLSAEIIDIEIDISNGLYSFNIVGLGDKSVGESKDRVSSALKYSGFTSPKQKNQKLVISLAPAHIKKYGPSFDLPMAISYLVASGEIKTDLSKKLFIGELALNGETRKSFGVMQITKHSKDCGFDEIYLPHNNLSEASFIGGIKIYPVKNLKQLVDHLNGEINDLSNIANIISKKSADKFYSENDLSDIVGQETAKRGLLIAASGGHNIAFYGPPGTGKTMLAKSFSDILPNLEKDTIIETTSIHSLLGTLQTDLIIRPPFRAPHHTSSYSAIVGGGTHAKPGEITLSHNGILFLDELPEFDKRVINSLREPLEEKKITISRSSENLNYPANFILIAAMNPCPCGYFKTKIKDCSCTPSQISQYQKKVSGPIIDRIDLWIEVTNLDKYSLSDKNSKKSTLSLSEKYRNLVKDCRKIQIDRQNTLNSQIKNKEIGLLEIDSKANQLLSEAFTKYKLSMRSCHKIIKIARTIADLENSQQIKKSHVLEALQFRQKNF